MKIAVEVLIFFVIFCSICFALSPLRQDYKTAADFKQEFNNIFINAQDRQFTIYNSTPAPASVLNGQFILISTGNYAGICTNINSSTNNLKCTELKDFNIIK